MSTTVIDKEFENFVDKITGFFFKNPVIACDGHIYERDILGLAILNFDYYHENFDDKSTFISPITGLKIKTDYIVPIEFTEQLIKFYTNHPETKEKQYGYLMNKFETLLESEINEDNINKILSLFENTYKSKFDAEIKFKTIFRMEYGEWMNALLHTEKGIYLYVNKFYSQYFDYIGDKYEDMDMEMQLISYLDGDMYEYYITLPNLDKNKLFESACSEGHIDICKRVYDMDNNVVNFKYESPLFYACYDLEILQFLHSKNNNLYKETFTGHDGNQFEVYEYFGNSIIQDEIEIFKWYLSIDDNIHKLFKFNYEKPKYTHIKYEWFKSKNIHSVFAFLLLNGKIEMLNHLYSVDKNIYKDEPDKIELIAELKTSKHYSLMLPLILDIILDTVIVN